MMHSRDANAPVPNVIIIRPDERVFPPAASGYLSEQPLRPRRQRRRSLTTSRRQDSPPDERGRTGDVFHGNIADESDAKVIGDEPPRWSSATSACKESVQILSDRQAEQVDEKGSIEVLIPPAQRPRRRMRRRQRRLSLDPGALRGSDAQRRPNSRPRRKGTLMPVKHMSEPAVAFSYSDKCFGSSISDSETDQDDSIGGILSPRYDLYVSDDKICGSALVLPSGEDGTTASDAEAFMSLGDLCASMIPPKIASKPH